MRSNEPVYFHTVTVEYKAGLPDEQAGLFSMAFEDSAYSFSCRKKGTGWDLFWTFPDEPVPDKDAIGKRLSSFAQDAGIDPAPLDKPILRREEDRNWLEECYRALPPLSIGSFFVYGSHFEGVPPDGKIPLLIEAATAFGSGEHGTTSRCMMAIEHVHASGFSPRNILDMGCGSGILAAAAARLWPDVPVYAADNDPECIVVTKRHLEVNDIKNVTAYQSEGYDPASPVWKEAPYDFIIANILAGPLIDMAAEQSRALAEGGYLILSGTLREQADRVLSAYTPYGLRLTGEFPGEEWMTLLLQKN